MWYLGAASIGIAFILGIKYRNGNGVYLAMLGIIGGAVLIMFSGCASQPPVVVQAAPPPAPVIPPDPYAYLPTDVAAAIRNNETPVFHHGITWLEPYSPDLQYPLHCKPLHVTQIRLQLDEITDKDDVKVGDKDRWGTIVGPHSVLVFPLGTNTNITVPGAQLTIPRDPNMVTNLVISTNKGHQYVFNPITLTGTFTQAVEFYYPDEIRAQAAAREWALKQQGATR